jgi:hypothetical protein
MVTILKDRRRTAQAAFPARTGFGPGRSAFAVAVCLIASVIAPNHAAAQPTTGCVLAPSVDDPPGTLPDDVCDVNSNNEANFDALAWRIFKFLVWPASNAERGKPDTARKITEMDGPRTFETFKADWETFQPLAEPPTPWDSPYPRLATPCANHPEIRPFDLVLASFTKFGNLREVVGPGLSYVLIAQNRTYVRYLAAYNRMVFDKIAQDRLYNADTVAGIVPPVPGQPVPDATRELPGALTVKSAWIEITGPSRQQIDSSRFYIRHDAWLQDPNDQTCRKASVALVALHFVYKTPSRPQWIWSTFEHVDNVPESGESPRTGHTFNNGDLGAPMGDDAKPDYQIPLPQGAQGPGDPPRPYQVERLQSITASAQDANRNWQGALRNRNSVWQHYKLVLTQWPFTPFAPNQGAGGVNPLPQCAQRDGPATANTVPETFLQTSNACLPGLTCMGCHDGARRTDFVWSIRMNPYKPPNSRSTTRRDAIEELRDVLKQR